jgi:hypothetical protein
MSANGLATKAAGEALGKMLRTNTTLLELDVSYNLSPGARDGPGFAQGMSKGLSNNRALIKLDISSNYIGAEQKGGLQRICTAGGIELDV